MKASDDTLAVLIAEWRRLVALTSRPGISDDDIVACCEEARIVRDQIEMVRPTSLRGVLAVLDWMGELDDPDRWPKEAIEGLREIVRQEDQA